MDNNAKSQAIEQIKKAQNVLVTVSDDPSVDQLAACIGFTLLLNKLNKHATAVFSGKIPSTIEFLKPEDTLETNTDSLRDFIISLDKNKADKLRYKVEDDVVRIYITPYRTSISDKDLIFDQGDFNVDVIITIGVHSQNQLDNAIQNHGRILHDATIISVVNGDIMSEIGGINWQEKNASSLCEMLMSISESLKPGIVDEQIATALLTGIVAETDRFSNQKTTPKAMTLSAQLMSAGANQQLIAESLNQDQQSDGNLSDVAEKVQDNEPSLADIQFNGPEENNEAMGVLELHHKQEDRSTNNKTIVKDNKTSIVNDDLLGAQGKPDDINNPDELREVVNKVQQNKQNYVNDNEIANDEDNIKGLLADYSLPQPIDNNFNKGSFKGKTIAPLDSSKTSSILSDAPNLPDLDSTLNYGLNADLVSNYPFADPTKLPKEHSEDLLTEDDANKAIAQKNSKFDSTPEVNLDKSNSNYLDHPPTTGPNEDGHENSYEYEEELPSIDAGTPKYSKYLNDPPKDTPKLNALEGVAPNQTINPFADSVINGEAPKPQEIKSTQDPLLSTQHDAESASAREVPETRSPRLYDDGVSVKPLGVSVDDKDTLDQIEHSVENVTGAVHGHKVNDARKAVNDAFEELDLNSLPYLDLDSDPASNKAILNSDKEPNDAPPPLPPPLMPPGMPN